MRKKKDIFVGLVFVVIAVFVIIGSMGLFGDISVWSILFTFFLVIWLVKGLLKLRWGSILFPLAFMAIMYDEILGIENLTPWPVLFAAFFGSIGLDILFKGVRRRIFKGKKNGSFEMSWDSDKKSFEMEYDSEGKGEVLVEQSEDEYTFSSDVAFGSVSKYIKSQCLRKVNIDNAFGSTIIYFDDVILENGTAKVNIDNAFGEVKLYVPAAWSVRIISDESFGKVKETGIAAAVSSNHLNMKCDTAFGIIEIIYI